MRKYSIKFVITIKKILKIIKVAVIEVTLLVRFSATNYNQSKRYIDKWWIHKKFKNFSKARLLKPASLREFNPKSERLHI